MRSSGWKPLRLRIRKIAAYAGFFLVLTGIWGVFLFPSDELIRHVQCGLSQMAPDAALSIGRVGVVSAAGPGIGEHMPCRYRTSLRFRQIKSASCQGLFPCFRTEAGIPCLPAWCWREIRLELPLPVISSFQFRQIQADIGWQGEKLDIASITAAGVQMDGSLSGEIQVKTPLESSRLQISGIVHLKPEALARLKASFLGASIPNPKTDGSGNGISVSGSPEPFNAPLFSLK